MILRLHRHACQLLPERRSLCLHLFDRHRGRILARPHIRPQLIQQALGCLQPRPLLVQVIPQPFLYLHVQFSLALELLDALLGIDQLCLPILLGLRDFEHFPHDVIALLLLRLQELIFLA